MIINNIPSKFQPVYSKKNIEELIFDIIKSSEVVSEYIYLPVFWTSYYILNNYGDRSGELSDWINSLDKSKKYFTIVQNDAGIHVKNYDIDIIVFSAGGGGLNISIGDLDIDSCYSHIFYNNISRVVFSGNIGTYDIPLLSLPEIPSLDLQKDIYCSFAGRYDTHLLRMSVKDKLKHNNKFLFLNSMDYNSYTNIINRSIFSLCPRGFGYTSFRLYESLLVNSIPIYIWEDKISLPFSDEINWNDFCVIIHIDQIDNLEKILNDIDIDKMQQRISELKYIFSIKYTSEYIIKKISLV